MFRLFEETRKLCDQHSEARHFDVLAWHVLNTHVRPFTAKWHPQSKRGMLSALDATDEFRTELEALQRRLERFEVMLASLRDGALRSPVPEQEDRESARAVSIPEEMAKVMTFLRRYRLDEPAFPHQSTADQFFSEAQFEAYRSLGEHVGGKLFLRALVGYEMADSTSVEVERWFRELGKRLLELTSA